MGKGIGLWNFIEEYLLQLSSEHARVEKDSICPLAKHKVIISDNDILVSLVDLLR